MSTTCFSSGTMQFLVFCLVVATSYAMPVDFSNYTLTIDKVNLIDLHYIYIYKNINTSIKELKVPQTNVLIETSFCRSFGKHPALFKYIIYVFLPNIPNISSLQRSSVLVRTAMRVKIRTVPDNKQLLSMS
uniref:Hypotheticial protein n=1 Tax=Heterorhabditis bacteriophora TaxID=37862 RepID=A0A1I7WDY3_HETBA